MSRDPDWTGIEVRGDLVMLAVWLLAAAADSNHMRYGFKVGEKIIRG